MENNNDTMKVKNVEPMDYSVGEIEGEPFLDSLGKALSKLILTNFLIAAKCYLEEIGILDGEATESYFKRTGLLDVCGILAKTFYEKNNEGITINLNKDASFTLADNVESEIAQMCRDYIDFHRRENEGFYRDTVEKYLENYEILKLPSINTTAITPKHRTTPNSKLVNAMSDATFDSDEAVKMVLDVSRNGAKKKVQTICVLSYEGENIQIAGKKPFTEFDRNVYDAVCSLYAAGNRIITPDMVWRVMVERIRQEQPTTSQREDVAASIEKMRHTYAKIECADEFKMRRIDTDEKVGGMGFNDPLLHLSDVWMRSGRNKVHVYLFPQDPYFAPILYRHSLATKEMITTPIGLMDIKKLDEKGNPTTRSIEYTKRRVIITGYLRRRIEGMKGENGLNSRCIRFTDYRKDGRTHEGLYSIAGCPKLSKPMPQDMTEDEKTKRKNDARYIRSDAALTLDYWTATGYIKGYRDYRDGRKVVGFEIALTQDEIAAWGKSNK